MTPTGDVLFRKSLTKIRCNKLLDYTQLKFINYNRANNTQNIKFSNTWTGQDIVGCIAKPDNKNLLPLVHTMQWHEIHSKILTSFLSSRDA